MKLWKMTAFAVAAVVAMSLSISTFAADDQKGEKKHGPSVKGEIVSIDKECIKVKTDSGEEAIKINDGTTFGSKKDPKTVSDFKPGDKVQVGYKEEGGKKVAVKIGTPHQKKNQ